MVTLPVRRRRALLYAAVFLLAILAVQAMLKKNSEWLDVYVRAGRQWWAGLDIYGAGSSFLYPPFQAMVAAPFAALPEWLARLGWFTMSAAGMIVMVGAAWRLAEGRRLRDMPNLRSREWLAFAAGLACSFSYILNAFAHQQTDVLIGALLIGGAWFLAASRSRVGSDAAAGALLGLAAACKATPLLWFPYLLWRRRWAAASLLGAVALAVNLLPDLIPAPGGELRIVQWFGRFVLPTQQLDMALGHWGSSLEYNQSLGGTVQRLVNTRLEISYPNLKMHLRPALPPITLKLVVYGLFVTLIAVSIVASMRAGRDQDDGGEIPSPQVFEFSIVLILMLLMSPMSGRAHFGILILPAFCLARIAAARRDRVVWAILAVVAFLTLAANKDLVGSFAHGVGLWLGVTTGCTVLLWGGCIYALCFSLRRPSGAAPAIPSYIKTARRKRTSGDQV